MSQIINDTSCIWERKFVFVLFNDMKPEFTSVQWGWTCVMSPVVRTVQSSPSLRWAGRWVRTAGRCSLEVWAHSQVALFSKHASGQSSPVTGVWISLAVESESLIFQAILCISLRDDVSVYVSSALTRSGGGMFPLWASVWTGSTGSVQHRHTTLHHWSQNSTRERSKMIQQQVFLTENHQFLYKGPLD